MWMGLIQPIEGLNRTKRLTLLLACLNWNIDPFQWLWAVVNLCLTIYFFFLASQCFHYQGNKSLHYISYFKSWVVHIHLVGKWLVNWFAICILIFLLDDIRVVFRLGTLCIILLYNAAFKFVNSLINLINNHLGVFIKSLYHIAKYFTLVC